MKSLQDAQDEFRGRMDFKLNSMEEEIQSIKEMLKTQAAASTTRRDTQASEGTLFPNGRYDEKPEVFWPTNDIP